MTERRALASVASHTFHGSGPFTVSLTVTDDGGNTSSAQQQLGYRTLSSLDVPICGDQDDGTAVLRCPDYTREPDIELWRVAGNGTVDVTFDWVYRNAGNNNQLSAFVVDDDQGTIDGVRPGEAGYAQKAVARAREVFAVGSDASTADSTLPFTGGDRVAFYISIQPNETLASVPDPADLVLFSIGAANVDRIPHALAFERPGGPSEFSFEDLAGGGDGDFDDVVFTAAGLTTTVVQLDLSPATANAVVGDSSCVTGTVTDGDGDPVAERTGGLRGGRRQRDVRVRARPTRPVVPSSATSDRPRAATRSPAASTGSATRRRARGSSHRTNAPVAQPQAVETDEGVPVGITLVGTDADGDPLTYSVAQPAHGVVSGSGATVTYTPAAGFSGADSFTFTVSDGEATSAAATVSVTVRDVVPPNTPPVADAQAVTTKHGVAVGITLVGTDADGDPLTYSVGQPAHGVVSGSGAGVTYTPAAGFSGADSFTFTVSDGEETSAPATVSITVQPPPPPPPTTNRLLVSADAARTVNVRGLDGQTFRSGEPIYAFVGPQDTLSAVKRVTFWIDDPARTGAPFSVEDLAGFDLARTADNGKAYPLESSLLSIGTHHVVAKVEYKQGPALVLTATFRSTWGQEIPNLRTKSQTNFKLQISRPKTKTDRSLLPCFCH